MNLHAGVVSLYRPMMGEIGYERIIKLMLTPLSRLLSPRMLVVCVPLVNSWVVSYGRVVGKVADFFLVCILNR